MALCVSQSNMLVLEEAYFNLEKKVGKKRSTGIAITIFSTKDRGFINGWLFYHENV